MIHSCVGDKATGAWTIPLQTNTSKLEACMLLQCEINDPPISSPCGPAGDLREEQGEGQVSSAAIHHDLLRPFPPSQPTNVLVVWSILLWSIYGVTDSLLHSFYGWLFGSSLWLLCHTRYCFCSNQDFVALFAETEKSFSIELMLDIGTCPTLCVFKA